MRRMLFAICLAAGTVLPAAAQRFNESTTLAPFGSRFSVRVPGTPVEKPLRRTQGMIGGHMYSVDRGAESYTIADCDYSWDVITRKSVSAILNDARDGGIRNVKGSVISERSISINGYPGRDIVASVPLGTGTGRTRTYFILAGNRLYALVYVAAPGSWDAAASDAFFRSFYIQRPLPQYDWRRSTTLNRFDFRTRY